ncbi:MAG: oligopeptide transporter, OPT family [Simkania sp.]|uniref:Putative oligopeptide transporter HI_0561 n=1 Tax=Simkania negevensis (strain ATCC VR-1471 / DSM 27360 / Z) TaxID=331113 RepID=F8L5S4_SIMNZ|nr:oligopeptide transporter, OPT family [Simkania negevensis]MCB1066957.1 oligopeptide transporter, OPT family [Simkania sp.]MCP5491089.1 oligopeptide transporter, OPT family [Chlamydiales bacterium]MCB1075190.1 oligopeptide transporter, OPT family [Simkania sp.]MCB1084100.1 oligopeptide transporter, OPT family [Simkania sp.]CCB88066.1 putative oligopeptide transporter HI_0561 [Simkania negevensis Z]
MKDHLSDFKPFVASTERQKEFSWRAIILGIILSVFFAIGNAYLGLKVGMTISASIPAAVMSMAILRAFFRNVSILENNIVQTVAAVGEGLAAGVIFTIPALFILGDKPPILNIFLLAVLGGILGVLFMIPMRRYIIVQEHGILPFPEGTACAEILKAGEKSQPNAILALWGIIIGALYKTLNGAFYLWNETMNFVIKPYEKAVFGMDGTPALLGVGYIIGPRISAVLFAGGALGWWVLIPLIKMFGEGMTTVFPATTPISQMESIDIWSNYIRYIGAGAVAAGGLITLFRIIPVIRRTMIEMLREVFHLFKMKKRDVERTDHDISLSYLLLGSLAIIIALWAFPGFHLNIVTIILLVVLGFFFVAVTSITVGIVGSSSSPVSGMTITTLLITCLILLGLGWTSRVYLLGAITMSAVANIAIALGSTTSQDLKTGFLLGATPRSQQIAEIIGLFLPAIAIGFTIYLLDDVYKFGSTKLPAPQATLMALIAKGVIQQQLPLTLVIIGVVLGFLVYFMRVSVLAFAIGLYLPISLSTSVMFGGLIHLIFEHFSKDEKSLGRGILMASGLVAGDACMGVIIALLAVLGWIPASKPGLLSDWFSLAFFIVLSLFLGFISYKKFKAK